MFPRNAVGQARPQPCMKAVKIRMSKCRLFTDYSGGGAHVSTLQTAAAGGGSDPPTSCCQQLGGVGCRCSVCLNVHPPPLTTKQSALGLAPLGFAICIRGFCAPPRAPRATSFSTACLAISHIKHMITPPAAAQRRSRDVHHSPHTTHPALSRSIPLHACSSSHVLYSWSQGMRGSAVVSSSFEEVGMAVWAR